MDAKRGYVPEDERNFSAEALEVMKTASRQIFFLLNEGYDLKQATVFVGNHFLLSERQRLAIMRSLASSGQLSERKQKEISLAQLKDGEVWIDGFNTIITLEVMLCGSPLFIGMDGTVRDLAALRGTYRLIPETAEAAEMMLTILQEAGVQKIHILLDEPVSNSGRLKALIAEIAEAGHFPETDIRVIPDVDRALYEKERVITTDSVILDHSVSWVNLIAECLRREGRSGLQVWD